MLWRAKSARQLGRERDWNGSGAQGVRFGWCWVGG